MADMSDEQVRAAHQRVRAVIDDLSKAISDLRRLRDDQKLPEAYANAQIDELRDRRSDYEDLDASLSATTSVSSLPSDADVDALAAAVTKLHADNVAEAAARGAINEIATIVGAAAALGGEEEAAPAAAPAPAASKVSIPVVIALAAVAFSAGAALSHGLRRS